MQRFRKKSDVKHSEIPSFLQGQSSESSEGTQNSLPELPPANDFRTSLILPDLTRRFSVLRSTSGEPVTLDDLRYRFAERRARGAEITITEEVEDMLFESLGRIRPKVPTTPERSRENVVDDTSSLGTSVSSSPGGRSAKRYSNNLFGSGRLRDYTYLRSVASSKNSSSRTVSLTPTEASTTGNTSSIVESFRPMTPDGSSNSTSTQSSPEKHVIRSAPLVPSAPYGEQSMSVAEYRIAKAINSPALKRASMVLEEVIKELEDEVEDEIVMPRSTPVPRANADQQSHSPDIASHLPDIRDSNSSTVSSMIEAGMAISSDKLDEGTVDDRRASPIPARILPGYIPGMPRPMTPRDFDPDDQRSLSTTPRATSPTHPSYTDSSGGIASSIASGLLRRESNASTSRQSPRPTTPMSSTTLFLQRSTNGRYTPDDGFRGEPIEFDSPLNSSILGRRRPASPLAGQSFQPLTVSSRPSTPSNITWTPNNDSKWTPGHSRNSSWVSDGGVSSSDFHGSSERLKFSSRVWSPTLPDSPTADRTPVSQLSNGMAPYNERSPSALSNVESSLQTNSQSLRSVTPTQNASRSPISPTFSNFDKNGAQRSSKQNSPSPFNLGSFPSLTLSPGANSSRSSLESAGSSYHSLELEKDRTLDLFNDGDQQQTAWYDILPSDKSTSTTPGDSPDDEWDAEKIIKTHAGLKKTDFMAIQEKLVSLALVKEANPEIRERAPSSLRRVRRPSTSQSNYSTSGRDRVTSPPPQQPASPTTVSPQSDQSSKRNALLNSVVESIQSNHHESSSTLAAPQISRTSSDRDISPTTRRNRDLTRILFGEEGKEPSVNVTSAPEQVTATSTTEPASITKPEPVPPPVKPSFANNAPPISPFLPYTASRNASTPRIPQTPQQEADLAREVQQKTEAAMLALKKRPSKTNLNPELTTNGSIRRRINPNQISTPKLVSASTSVDTIPLRSPSLSANNSSGPSKIGSRFKKLRGSLRAKNLTPTGEEVTPFPVDLRTPPATQIINYDSSKLGPSSPASSIPLESNRSKVSLPSPPASSGPGLKGFMARFRNKQRIVETPTSPALSRPSPAVVLPTQSGQSYTQARPTASDTGSVPPTPRQEPARPPPTIPPAIVPPPTSIAASQPTQGNNDDVAFRQLFDAAHKIGLSEEALSDLLVRSGSTSSRSDWARFTRSNSVTRPESRNARQGTSTGQEQDGAVSYDARSPSALSGQFNPSVSGTQPPLQRSPSARKSTEAPRRAREGLSENATNAVVRRTIIYPSDVKGSGFDISALIKKTSIKRRRASATSVSNRSVHDRAPTPPPPKSNGKRFSTDNSPPVPHMPNAHPQHDYLGVPAGGPIEKSNSTYDSLYEMYAGESRVVSSAVVNDPNGNEGRRAEVATPEAGQAIQLIELANGETIWSIVNGLRDEDDESVYTGRASFASEYSTRESEGGFVKEHGRSGSKGSTTSMLSRKKPQQQGKVRPETKVFYSSSAQIGRLIEDLSQGKDAASFNFLPNTRPGHSASSSLSTNDINWTVEERLERMLGAMGNAY